MDLPGKTNHTITCPTHSGNKGHYCWDWDGLYICADCPEFECCSCSGLDKETSCDAEAS